MTLRYKLRTLLILLSILPPLLAGCGPGSKPAQILKAVNDVDGHAKEIEKAADVP